MRVLLVRVMVAVSAAGLVMACASGGDGDDPLALMMTSQDDSGTPGTDSGSPKTAPPSGRDSGTTPPPGDDSGKTSPPDDASAPGDSSVPTMDASTPTMDASVPTKDASAPPPPPPEDSGSDECDTSNPIYAIEAAAEVADGDEQLCITGCSASQCCYELLCVAK
jgi:hypothetical protein